MLSRRVELSYFLPEEKRDLLPTLVGSMERYVATTQGEKPVITLSSEERKHIYIKFSAEILRQTFNRAEIEHEADLIVEQIADACPEDLRSRVQQSFAGMVFKGILPEGE